MISFAKMLHEKKTTLVGSSTVPICTNRNKIPKKTAAKKDTLTKFTTQLHRSKNCNLTIYKSNHY